MVSYWTILPRPSTFRHQTTVSESICIKQLHQVHLPDLGVEMCGYFVPLSDEIVANNDAVISNLRSCGRLMMMGLLMTNPVYCAWVCSNEQSSTNMILMNHYSTRSCITFVLLQTTKVMTHLDNLILKT